MSYFSSFFYLWLPSVTDIRREAAGLSNLAENRFRLVWQGNVLGDDFDVEKLSKGLVMVVPMPEPRPLPGPKPEAVKAGGIYSGYFPLPLVVGGGDSLKF